MDFLEFYEPFRAFILVPLPKIIQSVFAALGDFYTWRLATEIYGMESNVPWAAVSLSATPYLNPNLTMSTALDDSLEPLAVVLLHQDIFQLARDDAHHSCALLLAVGTAQGRKGRQGRRPPVKT